MQLEITSVPSVRTGHIYYHVPINGGVAIWVDKGIALDGTGTEHFNWDVPASSFIAIAEVTLLSSCYLSMSDILPSQDKCKQACQAKDCDIIIYSLLESKRDMRWNYKLTHCPSILS